MNPYNCALEPYEWTMDTFGEHVPENWDIIAVTVNGKLHETRMEGFSYAPVAGISAELLKEFKRTGSVCGVTADYRKKQPKKSRFKNFR